MVDVLDIDKTKYDKLLRRVGKRAASRNTVAHDQFQPNDEGNGVRFVIVKAKGLYGTPSAAWTEKRFEQEGCLLDGIKAQLIEFNEVLGKSPIQRSGRDSNLCLDTWPVPMRRTFSPALYNFQSLPFTVLPPEKPQE